MADKQDVMLVNRDIEAPTDERVKVIQDEPSVLDAVLEGMVANPRATVVPRAFTAPIMRSARLVALDGRHATITWRGNTTPMDAEIAPEVEEALLALALRNGDGVLVEVGEGDKPLVVGVLQTRLPREMHISADEIHIDAARELVLRAGRAALRLREDGEVELIGSRISATSQGLFRLVGRILRLN